VKDGAVNDRTHRVVEVRGHEHSNSTIRLPARRYILRPDSEMAAKVTARHLVGDAAQAVRRPGSAAQQFRRRTNSRVPTRDC
jgi:hypothetical protein